MNVRDIEFGDHRIKQILIVRRRSGTDLVLFDFHPDAPSPFPEDKGEPGMCPPSFRLECRKGYAEEWLKLTFGVNPLDLDFVIQEC